MAPDLSEIPAWLNEEFGPFGAALAIIDKEQSHLFYHGLQDVKTNTPVNAKTAFEIGSVSKTMVGLLLADALIRQEVVGTEPIQKYVPQLNQHRYTLLDLASHHSGLPRLPINLPLDDLRNPYRDFDQEKLLSGLEQTTPAATPDYEYSNLGFGLLGQILAERATLTLDQLFLQRIFQPIGMTQSTLARPQQQIPHLATAYQPDGVALDHWQFQALAGAGAVVSTLPDLQKYAQAYLMAMKPTADPRFALSLKPQRQLSPEMAIAMGWMFEDSHIYWHNGQTAGFSSFIALDLTRQRAVILLSNVAIDVTESGQLLMNRP
jgi:CubicO group peptidase (beta-lactamase class C family)